MAEQFRVTPPELRSVARDLAEVSAQMTAVMSSLDAQLAGEGAAWGNDSLGHQFANGANGYLAQRSSVAGSVDAKTNLLDYYAEQLRNAANTFEHADKAAASGPHHRWSPADLTAGASDDASAAPRQSPQARAQQIRVPGVDALTAVTPPYDGNGSVLTPAAQTLASTHLDAMSPAHRAAFEKLVAHASSMTEAEYLWKAASAGYTVGQLTSFDAVIHPHANNTEWLESHLDAGSVSLPTFFSGSSRATVSFDNPGIATVTQGQDPTRVAASTMMARLAADPVLMLGVTTGQGPAAVGGAKPGDDSQAAVAARAHILFNRYYADGRTVGAPKFLGIIADPAAQPPGVRAHDGAIAFDDRLLTPVAGSTSEYQPLSDTADRHEALPKIEAAAQAGKPAPIEEYHRHNGQSEIDYPWGYTPWVPTQQFVDGQRGAVTEANGSPGPPQP